MEAQDNKTSSIKPCQRSKIKTQYSIELKCLVHPKEKAQKCVESQIKKPSRLLFFFLANSWSWARSKAESNI